MLLIMEKGDSDAIRILTIRLRAPLGFALTSPRKSEGLGFYDFEGRSRVVSSSVIHCFYYLRDSDRS